MAKDTGNPQTTTPRLTELEGKRYQANLKLDEPVYNLAIDSEIAGYHMCWDDVAPVLVAAKKLCDSCLLKDLQELTDVLAALEE